MKIHNKEYKFKPTLKAMFIFEQIAKKQFELKTLFDNYLYYYCILLANNSNFNLSFDDFINLCDEDKEVSAAITQEMTSYINTMSLTNQDTTDDKKKQ